MKQDGISNDLELKNFIPKGAVLKNSEEVYACVLYTGVDTKLVMNQGFYKFKISYFNKVVNKFMIVNIACMFIFDVLMS